MQPLLDTSAEEFAAWLSDHNQPRYRAAQLQQWIYARRLSDFAEMSDAPKKLRSELAASFTLFTSTIAKHSQADDGSEKLLVRLADGQTIESVLLRNGDRRTVCVSTQVGCAMGCVFCASGLDGVVRNLTKGEIIEQLLHMQRLLPEDERLTNIVVMGMGEPLANLTPLLAALDRATAADALDIGARRVTISTVGLPTAIDRLAKIGCRYQLAISLHAANDELRNRLVPVNHKITLQPIMAAADRYFAANGRRLTFEYVLLAKVNDRDEDAHELAELLRGRTALLNVIPYNPVAGLPYRTPSSKAVGRFREILESAGVTVKFRHRKGDRIDAACGQLRRMQTSASGGEPDVIALTIQARSASE